MDGPEPAIDDALASFGPRPLPARVRIYRASGLA